MPAGRHELAVLRLSPLSVANLGDFPGSSSLGSMSLSVGSCTVRNTRICPSPERDSEAQGRQSQALLE